MEIFESYEIYYFNFQAKLFKHSCLFLSFRFILVNDNWNLENWFRKNATLEFSRSAFATHFASRSRLQPMPVRSLTEENNGKEGQ